MTSTSCMKYPEVTLPELVGKEGIFIDGDWVESKDQDKDGDVRLLQLADIGVGEYLNKSNRFMTSAKAKALKCTYVLPGDILIARMPDPVGRACIFTGDEKPCVTVVDVCILRPDTCVVDSNWLVHRINSPGFQNEISSWITGSTRQRISRGNLSKLKLPLPPLPEQKRIAAILDKADSIRRKRQEAVRLTEDLLRSVFLDMFGDPVTNPKGWETRAFVEVCETRLGKMLDANQQTGKHLRPYLRNSNVQWDRIETTDLEQMDFNEKDRKTFSLKYDDVLICEGGEVGRAAIWRNQMPDCYFQKAIHRVRPNQSLVLPEYIMFWLWFMAKNGGFKDHVTSATIAHLTGEKLKEVQIALPPIAMQHKFLRSYNSITKLKASTYKHKSETDTLFNTLLYRAFIGESMFSSQLNLSSGVH